MGGKENLRATLKEFLVMRPDIPATIVRGQVEASIKAVLAERPAVAARDESASPEFDKFDEFVFPSGLPFRNSQD